jgi:hypothetical protein
MKARLLKSAKVKELFDNIEQNLCIYRAGDFDFIRADNRNSFEADLDIDEIKLAAIGCTQQDNKEIQNCEIMLNSMGNLTPYLARDARIWVYLTHTELLDYSRNRWPIPTEDEKAVKHVKDHFFITGARGFERDNAASRLWWMAFLCARVDGLSLEEVLSCFLYQSDVRANIIERPTTSQNLMVFSSLVKELHKSIKTDKLLFEREKFREVMKRLNLQGGVKLLGALDKETVQTIIENCI